MEKDERLVSELSKLNISSKNTIFYSKRLIGKSFFDKSLDKIKEKSLSFEILDDKESQKIKIGIENENKNIFLSRTNFSNDYKKNERRC